MNHVKTVFIVMLLIPGLGLAAEPKSMDPDLQVPPLKYIPVLGDYQSFREAKVGSWKQLNAAASGEESDNAQSQDQPPAKTPAPADPHAGHHMNHKK